MASSHVKEGVSQRRECRDREFMTPVYRNFSEDFRPFREWQGSSGHYLQRSTTQADGFWNTDARVPVV
jgi:hypothetical protein